jgi:hypothetical protein
MKGRRKERKERKEREKINGEFFNQSIESIPEGRRGRRIISLLGFIESPKINPNKRKGES